MRRTNGRVRSYGWRKKMKKGKKIFCIKQRNDVKISKKKYSSFVEKE